MPAPFGPRIAKIMPRGTSRSIPSTARSLPNVLTRPRAEMADWARPVAGTPIGEVSFMQSSGSRKMKANFGAMAARQFLCRRTSLPSGLSSCQRLRHQPGSRAESPIRSYVGYSLGGFSLDHGAGLTVSGITGRLAFVVVLSAVDHQCFASYRRVSTIQLDHAVENLGTQNALGADPLIWHIARVRAFPGEVSMFGIRRIEVPTGRGMAALMVAFSGLMNMKRNPFARRQSRHLQLYQHAVCRLGQRGRSDLLASHVDEFGFGGRGVLSRCRHRDRQRQPCCCNQFFHRLVLRLSKKAKHQRGLFVPFGN
ncbi:hypothetical protein MES5069_720015 [Mesorhizobium escarrei]|uniref:Uncharacterized protein n=1 Tax=Mesorhizobium escarrei TaxID=666018 RepID=A0ABN8KF31_9HYPH|nr:hypothetical protein MES5069_720015 [Mesorhizobium escarrei]